jgi:hypothetical protein
MEISPLVLAHTLPVVVPVLVIMPELQRLCEEPYVVLPIETSSLEALAVPMMPTSPMLLVPSKPPVFVDHGGLDATSTHFHVAIGQPVSLSDEVDDTGPLSPSSEVLFAKEVFDLLVSLEMASPGAGVEIACLLTRKSTTCICKKVKKSLRSKSKKSGATKKAYIAA